jgi:CHAD domain-containing protein
MKPQRVPLSDAMPMHEAMLHVVGARLAEAGDHAAKVDRTDCDAMHAFRIACKRLRFALERLATHNPLLDAGAAHVALAADALGEVHDCDVLLAELPESMPKTRATLSANRERCAARSLALWNDADVILRETLRFVASSNGSKQTPAGDRAPQ